MKVLVEKELGGNGGKVGLYINEGVLEAKASIAVASVVDMVSKPLDPLKAKLEALIPGDWENALVDEAFVAAKAEISKLLSE